MRGFHGSVTLLLLLLVTNVFSQPASTKYQKFSQTVVINSGNAAWVKIPPVLLSEMTITSNKDYLISMNPKNDTIFRVFKLPELVYSGGFGVEGRGPTDFSITNMPVSEPNGFLIPSFTTFRIIGFNKNEKVTNQSFKIINSYKIPGDFYPVNAPMILSDSLVCCTAGIGSSKQMICYNPKTNRISYLIDFPRYYFKSPHKSDFLLYMSYKSIAPSKEKIAIAYQSFPLIAIHNTAGELLCETFTDEGPRQRKITFSGGELVNGINNYKYYNSLKTTDKYIYAGFLVWNREQGAMDVSFHTEHQIHIFDWNGKPVLKVILFDKRIKFAPSHDDMWLYFIHPDFEDKIFKFALGEILNNHHK